MSNTYTVQDIEKNFDITLHISRDRRQDLNAISDDKYNRTELNNYRNFLSEKKTFKELLLSVPKNIDDTDVF